MKKSILLAVLVSVVLFSCSKDNDKVDPTPTPLVADFTATVTGESPNAQVSITNNSTGATTYAWTFGKGASDSASSAEIPSVLTVDKTGGLSIKLVVSNGTEEKEVTKSVSIPGHNAIITYTDVEFALISGNAVYGRLFSFETGLIYKDSEINAGNGAIIHLAFGSMGNVMFYFESPDVADYNVPNATATKVTNYESTPSVSVVTFEAMADDNALSGLTIVNTNESFGNSSIPGTVLFQISTGRKGVIKTKAINSDRILVDIKIQKY